VKPGKCIRGHELVHRKMENPRNLMDQIPVLVLSKYYTVKFTVNMPKKEW
jgi:hypothetical protein